MSTVKSAFHSIADRIGDNSIFEIEPIIQDESKKIRYSKKSEFNDKIVKNFFNKKIDLESKKFDISLLNNPYFFDD